MAKDDDGPYTPGELRTLLADFHEIERIEMEIAQPDRLGEVLAEMVRRAVIEASGDGTYRLA